MNITIASALVNWVELWKIVLAALVGGAGIVSVFGLLLLGLSRAKTATRPTAQYGLYAFSGVCGFIVVAVATVGVYAMTRKPASAPSKPKASAALTAASR